MAASVSAAGLLLAALAGCGDAAAARRSAAAPPPAAPGAPAAAVPAVPAAGTVGGVEAAAVRAGSSPPPPAGPLRVRRGDLTSVLLLSGELQAARADTLTAPHTPSFQLKIRWLAEDGAVVAAGQPVVQFDNATFVAQLDDKRTTASTARSELERIAADGRSAAADKGFAVEQKRTDLDKARRAAGVPPELLPRREYQDRQLAMQRAESELAKAEDDLAAQRTAAAADLAVQRLVVAKAERDVATAETAIGALTVLAPHAGIVLIAEIPWEGRKLREGDDVWMGMAVATLPDTAPTIAAVSLSDVDDGKVAPGMEAVCYLDAYPGTAYRGRVTEVAKVARESGRTALLRTLPVRVALDPLPAAAVRRLRPGMSVRVEIATATARDALLVPRAALDFAALPAVRVLLAGGGQAPVRLGPCDAFWCVAQSGVALDQALRPALAAGGADGAGGGGAG